MLTQFHASPIYGRSKAVAAAKGPDCGWLRPAPSPRRKVARDQAAPQICRSRRSALRVETGRDRSVHFSKTHRGVSETLCRIENCVLNNAGFYKVFRTLLGEFSRNDRPVSTCLDPQSRVLKLGQVLKVRMAGEVGLEPRQVT